jgi:hypothetical protein
MDVNEQALLAKLSGRETTQQTPPAPIIPPLAEPPVEPTPPPANPPAEPPVEPPVNPMEQYEARAKELGYNSLEDFLNGDSVKKIKEYDTVLTEAQKIREQNEMLLAEFGKTKNPFVKEEVYKLNHLLSTHEGLDPKTAMQLINTDISALNPLDALLLDKKISEPLLSDKQAKLMIAKEFGQDTWDELTDKMNEDEDTKDFITGKSFKAKKELEKYNVSNIKMETEAFVPEKIQQELDSRKALTEEAITKIGETWKPAADYLEANFNELPVFATDKDGKVEEVTKMVLKPEEKKALADMVVNFAKQQGLTELNEKTKQIVEQYAYSQLLLSKIPTMVRMAMDKARSDAILEYEKERDNPDFKDGKKTDVNSSGKATKDIMDVFPKPKTANSVFAVK